MKKVLSVALATVFFLILIPCATSAAPAVPSLYMRPLFNETKDHLTVEIYTYGLNWTSLDVGIQFDTSALTLISITEGAKLGAARKRGADVLSAGRDVALANAKGYGNFVASIGTPNYKVTTSDGSIVVFAFAVKDLAKAKQGYHLCISHLTDTNGKKLADYTSFAPDATPVVHIKNEDNPFQYGDTNGDGKIEMYDALLIMQHLVDLNKFSDEYYYNLARVSGGSEVAMYDALLVMQYMVHLIDSFPAEG
ncbi:MAG: dockerin type I repeat-containing protein [Clostridia bacterium]|nr:dockerin type I repeat-containing protein [Clostridia bacterium]MBQ5743276.1 dockerin type I repeat-containing protein [Clostridia bacterium]